MGALISCCLKGGCLEDLGFGSLKSSNAKRHTALQQQLADKDNSAVDGRKHSMMPAERFRGSPTASSPPLSSPGFGFGSTSAGSPGQTTGPEAQKTSSSRPERPQPPRRIQLNNPVWGSSEQNYQ